MIIAASSKDVNLGKIETITFVFVSILTVFDKLFGVHNFWKVKWPQVNGSFGKSTKLPVNALVDPPDISFKDLTKIGCIRENLEKSYKNGVNLQVLKNPSNFFKEKCKETSDLLNRQCLQENWTNQKSLVRIFQYFTFLAFFARLLHFPANIIHYLARSCKKLSKILQVLSDKLTRVQVKFSAGNACLRFVQLTLRKIICTRR